MIKILKISIYKGVFNVFSAPELTSKTPLGVKIGARNDTTRPQIRQKKLGMTAITPLGPKVVRCYSQPPSTLEISLEISFLNLRY